MSGVISIVLADDHAVVRQGLRSLLDGEPGFSVVAEAADGLEAVEQVERRRPDVLVTDLMMPGLHGLDVVLQARRRSPRTRVVVLSMHASEAYVVQSLRNGAAAFVLKEASAAELVLAIREAVAGRQYLGPPFTARAAELNSRAAAEGTVGPYESLTSREREILHLSAEGRTSAELAERLGISPRTAETHRANLMRKMGFRGKADLIRYAVEHGLVPLAPDSRPLAPEDPR